MMFETHDGRRRAAHDGWPGGDERFGPAGLRGRGRGRMGGPRGPRGGFRGRARRGDVRAAILALLAERPMHGYEMIQELGARTDGAWTPSPGSVYPTLTLLEEEGLVTSEEIDGKRRFVLTEVGTQAAAEREGPPPWEQVVADADPATFELRGALTSTAAAVKQVFLVGTPAQQAKAAEILIDARRKLYEVLASEG